MENISAKEAVCQYLGIDWDSASDYRYHQGMTTIPMYATDGAYVCATANGKRPSKRDQDYITNGDGSFVEATGQSAEYCKLRGRTIWVHKVAK